MRSLQLSSLLPRFRCDGHGLCSLGQPCVTRFSLPHVLGGGIVGYRAAGESRNFGKMATGYCIRNRRKASTTPGVGTRWEVEIRCYHDAGTSAPVHRCNGDSSIVAQNSPVRSITGPKDTFDKAFLLPDLCWEVMKDGGTVLVFCSRRSSTFHAAKRVVKYLPEEYTAGFAEVRLFRTTFSSICVHSFSHF